MGNKVQVYDFERTICDFIIHRDKIDSELFVKTLRFYGNYAKKSGKTLQICISNEHTGRN